MSSLKFCIGVVLLSLSIAAQEYVVKFNSVDNNFFEKPDPNHSIWNQIESIQFSLLPQNIITPGLKNPTVKNLKFKAFHNSSYIALLLEWNDVTKNDVTDVDKASDACAVQFARKNYLTSSPFMGHQDSPVVIFHWKAIWNRDIEKGYVQLKDIHPNAFTETYMFGMEIAKEVKNPVSNDNRLSPVEELHAKGFGTATSAEDVFVRSWGIKTANGWKVLFTYKFDPQIIENLKPKSTTGIAFAIWEGNQLNVGGRKNYSLWQTIRIE